MHFLSRAGLALLVNLIVLSPAAASGLDRHEPEARFSWSLAFGGPAQGLRTGYGLAVDVRAPGFEDHRATVVELDVTDAMALARFAGLPLYTRGWQLDQAEGQDPVAAQPAASPWYARQWVWWTLGGAAVSAAVAGGGGGGEEEPRTCTGICNQNDTGNNDVNVLGPDGQGCVGDTCVVCDNGDIASDCNWEGFLSPSRLQGLVASDPERLYWLDSGTGHMGDLIAR